MAGQIVPRGENTWMVRVFMGRDPETGTRRYHNHTIHGTKKDAQRYLNGVLREQDTGTFVEPTKTTLNEYLNLWLETATKPRVREGTYNDYKKLLDRYVRPVLGARRLTQLTPLDIQALYSSLGEQGLSPRTIRYTHAVLSSALKQAVKWRMLAQNSAEYVDLPRQAKREMSAFSAEDAARFLAAAQNDRWGIIFSFALATGMRPGEYLGLQWKDVDLSAGVVAVQRALTRTKDGWSLAEPKTSRSRRTIPLPPSMTRALKEHKQRQAEEMLAGGAEYKRNDFVFATSQGTPLDEVNLVKRNFKPILKAAGLAETIRLYDLRHSCATLLLSVGENPKVVSERLGHASITLTLDTYSHVLPTMQQAAAEKLEAVLFGQGKN